jgi:hypothetical protein
MKKYFLFTVAFFALASEVMASDSVTGLLGANISPSDFSAPVLKLSTSSGTLNPGS